MSVSVQIMEKRVLEPAAVQVASVAYMLIFGSSANNFVDGMSMGMCGVRLPLKIDGLQERRSVTAL